MSISTKRLVSALGGCLVASALIAAARPGVVVAQQQAPAAQAQPPRQAPARPRRDQRGPEPARGRGERPVQDARDSRSDVDRRDRRAAAGPDGHRRRRATASARCAAPARPGCALRANRAPQGADHEVDATGMYLMPGFVDMHVHAGGAPKNADAEYAYKLWLAHGVTTVRGVPLAGQRVHRSARRRAARRTRSSRRASTTISGPAAAGIAAASIRPKPPASTCAGPRPTASTASSSARTSRTIMAALLDEAKKNGLGSTAHLQQSGVGADERDQGGPPRARHRDALLRPLRIAAEGLRRPAVAGRHERERRAVALRSGGPPVEQDSRAGVAAVEGIPRRAFEARDGVRSDADDLFGRPRPDALPHRGVARQVHAAVADGRSTRRAARITARTGSTGRPRTRSSGATSIRCGSSW